MSPTAAFSGPANARTMSATAVEPDEPAGRPQQQRYSQRAARGSRHSPVRGAGTRRLAPPTTAAGLLGDVCFEVSRRYLLLPVAYRALAYATVVLLGSLFAAAGKPGKHYYMAQKHNVLNQLFVKWSWAWTMALLGPFVYLTARIYSAGDTRNHRQHLARLLVATILWYACTTLFVRVERATGRCSLPSAAGGGGGARSLPSAGRAHCSSAGGQYSLGFDISGHAFILVYCMMIMCEEAKVLRDWERLRSLLHSTSSPSATGTVPELSAVASTGALSDARRRHERDTPRIKCIAVAMMCLHLLWDVMLLCTVAFFHTLPHKVLGAAVAIACWALTYKLWYRLPASPGLPGHGPVCYIGYRRPSAADSRPQAHHHHHHFD